MKRVYELLKIAFCCNLGVFAGMSVYDYCDFKARPGLYAVQSAPWYTSILLHGVAAALLSAVLLLLICIVKRKMK